MSIGVPLTPQTRGLVGTAELAAAKPGALLVNTARGGVVDEDALYCALKEKRIAAAALDATLEEPACRSNLAQLPNCILTPHAGAATAEAANNMGMMAAQNLLQVLNGEDCHNLV